MIPSELFKKYNVPGPRYTSYPTVPHWDTSPTPEQWLEALSEQFEQAKKTKTGAAVYIHIPFCQSLCTYCGCNTRITRRQDVGTPYIETVLKEWQLYLNHFSFTPEISELHLGGGTPTFLTVSELENLLQTILSKVQISKDSEFSIEIDPRVTSKEQMHVLRGLGFRRVSMGIQDFDPKVQEIVHRVQSFEQIRDLFYACRDEGYTSINFDLIYGLPFQTADSVYQTIQRVCELKPDRIAFYSYAHVPWIKASQRRWKDSDLPSGEEKRRLYEIGRNLFLERGYEEVGMDHFALPTDSLCQAIKTKTLHRNFMGYISKHTNPLLGLGVSSIGDAWTSFAQNEKILERYQERVTLGEIPIHRGHLLTEEDLVLRRHILNLMTLFETSWGDASLHHPYFETLPLRLKDCLKDGLVTLEEKTCKVTDLGRTFLRNICMAFDARLARQTTTTSPLFSKTV